MTAETGAPACMPESLSPLKSTTESIHRIHFEISSLDLWYALIREANQVFGKKNWRAQPKIKRRICRNVWTDQSVTVWFDVPDPNFATWAVLKHSAIVVKNK